MTTVEAKAPEQVRKFPLTTLIAMVVGSMVGAGVFSLPRNFALATGVLGALIAWVIAGGGMLMLAFVFQTLAVRKPGLDAGVYAYAKAGFGEYLGFFSAFGYWASACVGNVTYWVLISSTLGLVWPGVFGHGDTLAAVALGSAGLWIFYLRELFVAELATFYTVFLVFAAGLDFLLLSLIIYTPGTVLFVMSRGAGPAAVLPGRAGHAHHCRGRLHHRGHSPGDRRNHHLGQAP